MWASARSSKNRSRRWASAVSNSPRLTRSLTVGAMLPAASVIFSASRPRPSEVCASPTMRASGTCQTPEALVEVVTYSVISFR